MKKIITLLFLLSISSSFGRDLPNFDKFWSILTVVESNNQPNVTGDGGKAIGIAQIHRGYFKDAIEYDKTLAKYKYEDCFNPEIAKKVVIAYISRYSKENDFEGWARLHNGGLNWKNKKGKAKENLDSYWAKFSAIKAGIK